MSSRPSSCAVLGRGGFKPHNNRTGDDMATIPTDAEIHAAAEQLGVLDENGDVPAHKRAQVAKALTLAAKESRQQVSAATDCEAFAQRIRQVQDALQHEGVSGDSSARVLGAIAAPLWREMKEKTAHDRTRD